MPKVSAEHKEAVRRRIMDAALVCLQRSGYQQLTTRELLAEAGLSIGTFYNYFPSKDHLYEALAEEMLANDVERVVDGSADRDSFGLSLVAFLQNFAMSEPQGAVAVATFRSRMDAGPDAAEAIVRLNRYVLDQFVPLVQKAQAEGWVRDDLDPAALVELVDIVWDGLGRREANAGFETSFEEVGATFIELVLRGALGERAPADLVANSLRREAAASSG
jgi:AcrR family transcriptional regulator